MIFLITKQEHACAKDQIEHGSPEYRYVNGTVDDLLSTLIGCKDDDERVWEKFVKPLRNGKNTIRTWLEYYEDIPTDEKPYPEDSYVMTRDYLTVEVADKKQLKNVYNKLKEEQDCISCQLDELVNFIQSI